MILPFLITPFRAPIGHKSNWEKECSITTIRPFKNYTEKNKSPISNNAIDPFINITEPISLNTNNSLPLSIDNDKALQSFNFSINQINRTKNFINNSEMNDISGAYSESEKKTLGSQAPPWALNNSRTKSEGISLSYLSESSQNNVLNFSINGTEGKEPFYLFNKNNYTENFYSLGGWGRKFLNDTVSRGKYNITLGSDLLLPSSESGSVSSIANIEDQFVDGRHYVGELNHSFHYNGTDTLKDALFQFDYKLSTAAENNSVNLSVYISNPQNEFSYIDSFYENSSESQSHATYNVSDLDTIIQERGDYHIIFHFKHFFHNKTNLGGWQNQISIDNVGFFLNYTARNVISNETFEINQELYNNNTILNQGRLTLEFNPGIFPDFFHVENWTFFCLINEYECFKKPIGDLNQNSWHSISSNVPEEYLSGLNFSLSFFLKYNGSSLLRFNDTHSWGLSLDNVSLICNQVQKWNSLSDHFFLLSPEKYLSPAMTDVQSIIIENDKSYPSILYEKSAGFWTSDYYPSLNITVDESYYEDNHLNDPSFREIQISGQIVFHYYTWREFLYEEFTDLISDVFSYYDSVQSDLIHGIREWDNILRFNKSLYAGFDGDFLKMQVDLYEKSGSFSRLFSSFLFFLSETEPQALNLTSEVYRSLVKNTTNSILPEKPN